MLFLIIFKYNIFFCGGQTLLLEGPSPLWGRGIPPSPPCIYFFDEKFGFVWGRGVHISAPSSYPLLLHLSHTLFIYTYIWICLSHLFFLLVTLDPFHLLNFPTLFAYYPVRLTLSAYPISHPFCTIYK